jgi:ubiquinone/menaquinone biosynthesis C-methylase UbiE
MHDHQTKEAFSAEWREIQEHDDVWGRPVASRVRAETRFLPEPLSAYERKHILDVGCGNGLFANEVAKQSGGYVIGMDISDGLNLGQAESNDLLADFIQADAQYPPFALESFDLILCLGSLPHTPKPRETFRVLIPLLRKGGTIFTWLYTPQPRVSLRFRLRAEVKSVVCKLPAPLKTSAVYRIAAFTLCKQTVKKRVLNQELEIPFVPKYRHHRMMARDMYTPPYDFKFTPTDLSTWHEENALNTVFNQCVEESDGMWLASVGRKT